MLSLQWQPTLFSFTDLTSIAITCTSVIIMLCIITLDSQVKENLFQKAIVALSIQSAYRILIAKTVYRLRTGYGIPEKLEF